MRARAVDRGFIPELDGLRGIAILLVMTHRFWPRTAVGIGADAAGAGWIGVDLFFVISGFLITGILLDTCDEPGYFKNFYARRVLRIFPLYYLFVGAVWIVLASAEFRAHAGSPGWYLAYLGNVPESVFGLDVPYWLGPVWSLAIEEQFYLTFPWLVAAVSKKTLVRVLIGMMIFAPAFRLVTMLVWPDNERMQYSFTLSRLDTIAIGCLLAVAVRELDLVTLRRRALTIGAVTIGVVAALSIATGLDRTTDFGRTLGYSFVAVGCAAVVSIVLLARDAKATAPLRWAPLRYFGKLCFGLYLLHRPADTIVTALGQRFGFERGLWLLPAKIAMALVLATIAWNVIERPFLSLKKRFASRNHPSGGLEATTRPLALVTIVLLSACGGGGGASPADGAVSGDDAMIVPRDGDNAVTDAMLEDGGVEHVGTPLYPEGVRHSPITPALAARLAAVNGLATRDANVMIKVGDSITALPDFVTCFDAGPVDLGSHTSLAPTVSRYLAGSIGSDSSYTRTSVAAVGGTTADDALTGAPCPLQQEIAATNGHVAMVMFGTNEIRTGESYDAMATGLWTVVDDLLARGVIPVLSTIPPLDGDPGADARIPTANGLIRAIAQGRGVPLIDFNRELVALPGRGIRSDGLHPTTSPDGACVLTTAGLQYGFNLRNLMTIEALARVDAALAGSPPDATAPTRSGTGTPADPYVAELPLASLGDTTMGDAATDACGGTGRAVDYRLTLTAAKQLTANVVDRGTTDVSIEILSADTCVAQGAATATATVGPGAVTIRVRGATTTADGEYLLDVR